MKKYIKKVDCFFIDGNYRKFAKIFYIIEIFYPNEAEIQRIR